MALACQSFPGVEIAMRELRLPSLLVFLLVVASPLGAQSDTAPACPWPGPAEFLARRASPPDSAQIAMGEALLKVCYSRPSARGRAVMGELVRYERLWRTGANEPTVLWVTAPLEVAGVHLVAGLYLLLSIPTPEEWTIVLHRTAGSTPEQVFGNAVVHGRGIVPVERTEVYVESFRIVGVDGAREGALVLEWEHTRVRIPVRVPATSPGGEVAWEGRSSP